MTDWVDRAATLNRGIGNLLSDLGGDDKSKGPLSNSFVKGGISNFSSPPDPLAEKNMDKGTSARRKIDELIKRALS